ncbi:MAG: hypothetical protein U9N82_08495, partial [Thermodesulfobacteriota bacterium]|nr:hypothetical protein [Thermodesulfobacteriota bacterium]
MTIQVATKFPVSNFKFPDIAREKSLRGSNILNPKNIILRTIQVQVHSYHMAHSKGPETPIMQMVGIFVFWTPVPFSEATGQAGIEVEQSVARLPPHRPRVMGRPSVSKFLSIFWHPS